MPPLTPHARAWQSSVKLALLAVGALASVAVGVHAEDPAPQPPPGQPSQPRPSSYMPVDDTTPFEQVVERMVAAKPAVQKRHAELLAGRYDLADRSIPGAKTSRGRPIQAGVRVRLAAGATWDTLSASSPADIKAKGLWPEGFKPLPHPNHPEGGMLFPAQTITELKSQTDRDLTRFDLEFDLPQHLLPDFPPAIFLTTRPDLGDVSNGELVTSANASRLFDGLLNPKQLEGLRLLVTPFPQQQFNSTSDRRSRRASQGVSCFDCHINGHTNAATHLVGDIRPQAFRHRLDTPTLRGLHVQRLFGSQRALKTVEDFTEFEQRAAYFDGDHVIAAKKGVNPLERGSQVHFMAEFQALLDFPPAPKLMWDGRLDPSLSSEQERRGEAVFHDKGRCSVCHPAPYFTDNSMHNLRTERFFAPSESGGHAQVGDGLIKTFPLRGIKDSPPYLHDGRLLTLEDTVLFFDVLLGLRLTASEREDLVAYLLCL